MPKFDHDLVVIGGGSGGVRAARMAAQAGASVVITEEYRYGGTCVIRGCVPKKLLVYASSYGHEFADAAGYGWSTGEIGFDWTTLIANKDREIARLSGIYAQNLRNAGVDVRDGRGVLLDPHTVDIGGSPVTAGVILVATGGRPKPMTIPGGEHAISSNEAFHLPELPRRIAVVGGGYIGVEFCHIFAGLGVTTTLVHHRHEVLRGFDDDIRLAVTEGLRKHGVELSLETEVREISRADDGTLSVRLSSGDTLVVDAIMSAVGRVPNTTDMGLKEAGVTLGPDGAVVVDDYSRSNIDHIYAVGDCTNRINLTPVAIREGQAFVDTVFGGRPTKLDHHTIPTAVFSQPTAATVGLTEAQARAELGEVDIYKSSFRTLKHTLTERDEKTMMKLVVARDSQRVVGVHMVGEHAAEIIQCLAIAVRMGATKADFDNTVALHPTTAEELVLMRQKSS